MLECYLDEHHQQKTGLYMVGVLAIDDSRHSDFIAGMAEIRSFARSLTGSATAELHAYDIFHGANDYRGVDIGERIKIFRDTIKLICANARRMCVKPINTTHADYRASGHAHVWALSWACEHIEKISDSSGWRLTPDDHPQLNKRVTEALDQARKASVKNCIRFKKLSNDSPVITRSHQSLGLQACDMALFCCGRERYDMTMGNNGQAPELIAKFVKMLKNNDLLLLKQTWP